MKKKVLILIILTILTKVIGFVREIVLSYYYGASMISDAYLISLTVPAVIFTFIGVGVQTTYMPMYSNVLNKHGVKVANNFTNNVVNMLLLVSSILTCFVLIFTEPIVKVFASGFAGETLSLAVTLTKISIFSIFCIGISYVFQGYLQLRNNFSIPALIGLPLNFFLVISIILSHSLDIKILGYGRVLAVFSQVLFMLPYLYKSEFSYKPLLNFSNNNLKRMIFLALPVMLGTSVNQINMLVDRTIASRVAVGGISALNYANRLNIFIQSIFVMSLATVLYANISKMAAENNLKGLKESLVKSINGINLLVIPTTIGSMIFAKPVIKLLFGRGAFDSQAILLTSSALFFYSIGMVGFGLREVLSRAFYSMQDTKTPMINAAIGMFCNIILNIILSKVLGIGGLALATSISAILTTYLMFVSLRKKIGSFGIKKVFVSFLKILCASLVMGLIAKLSFTYLNTSISESGSLFLSVATGVASYFTIIYFIKIEDVDGIVNSIKRRIKKNIA